MASLVVSHNTFFVNMIDYIINQAILRKITSPKQFYQLEREAALRFKSPLVSHYQLLAHYQDLVKNKKIRPYKPLEVLLTTKKARGLSGINVVTVLTKPYKCPGKCIYCPNETDIPKSYLKMEPAVQRAVRCNFDPKIQVQDRIKALESCGHQVSKIDLIILGGTFSAYPQEYQQNFIKGCFDGANFVDSKNLEQAKKINQTARYRIIGITIETRPDYIDIQEIKKLRKFGVTRVELGVQTVFDKILKLNQRGHSVREIIEATKLLKDAGIKVNYHLMPNLYGSSYQKDLKLFTEVFTNSDFKPDYLKIYPCVVLKSAKLYQLYQQKKFKPYPLKTLVRLLVKIKQKVPYYVRIQRLFRDIPSFYIQAGVKFTNLRQIVQAEMKKQDLKCRCIRCRQAKTLDNQKKYLYRQDYSASGGKEIFLSIEDKNREKLYSFLRLRIPSYYFYGKKHFLEVLNGSSIVRELHTYGKVLKIGETENQQIQHQGLGKILLNQAEKITKTEFKLNKIAVISGVGVREYYRKLGYRLEDEYMVKNFSSVL